MSHDKSVESRILTVTLHRVFFSLSFDALADQSPGSLGCNAFPTIHLLLPASHLEIKVDKVVNESAKTTQSFLLFQKHDQGQQQQP